MERSNREHGISSTRLLNPTAAIGPLAPEVFKTKILLFDKTKRGVVTIYILMIWMTMSLSLSIVETTTLTIFLELKPNRFLEFDEDKQLSTRELRSISEIFRVGCMLPT
jgi:hypothetical protein